MTTAVSAKSSLRFHLIRHIFESSQGTNHDYIFRKDQAALALIIDGLVAPIAVPRPQLRTSICLFGEQLKT
ncbi:hypothetical protein C9397_16560 [Xanthomonas vasicola pv. vasculorum]|uniref:Uncharacterized protein n=2 Tax=Xanthomonas vasicola pv. vasculorum TaxID=325776 RepID=A0A836P3K9_XANVA|nr:hypothetical protein C7V42_21630 [Xanthomonas vasicola pv. vasculorum]AZR28697.1 hypothetical protein NX80_022105 [Xanthomonas vasicola pv. arecae]KEZ95423.1 hypothetical protein A11M_0121220 [Xanthomonas vasicola pv. vasculorum NCPPB 895]KFA27129.1 hypothetical protein KW5_0112945 [Xanthomonas vasicola pv. vasculorum NCPPB 1326]KFA29411.1 hypothetical protein KWG_0115660 [Xanthomonas vasicola pv. vasculorum NCPPB 1381]KFA38429.1 hypothetical protein KWI_0100160 [Xanthomonas vasicola pv. va